MKLLWLFTFAIALVHLSPPIALSDNASAIPAPELEKIINSAGIISVWQIDQLETGDNGGSWAVSILSTPQTISKRFCSASLTNLGVIAQNGAYILSEKDKARRVISWKSCDKARSQAYDFHDVLGPVTDEELASIMPAIEDFMKFGMSSTSVVAQFDSRGLEKYVREKSLKHLALLQKQPDGSVLLSFWLPELFPDELDMHLTYPKVGIPKVHVSKGPGPDFYQKRRE